MFSCISDCIGYYSADNQNSTSITHQNEVAVIEYPCPRLCGRKYKHRKSLSRHLQYECGVQRKYRCDFCGKYFTYINNLKCHMGSRHAVT